MEREEQPEKSPIQFFLGELKKHGTLFLVMAVMIYFLWNQFSDSIGDLKEENKELKTDVKGLNEKYMKWIENDNKEMRELVKRNIDVLEQVRDNLKIK